MIMNAREDMTMINNMGFLFAASRICKNFVMIRNMSKKHLKIPVFVMGLLSLIWFIIRVIPKPSRAAYPCQRAAFPFASAFVIWVAGAISGKYFFKRARQVFASADYLLVVVFLIASTISFSLITLPFSKVWASVKNAAQADFEPVDNPNTPVGIAKGIFPGRVVWCYNPNATSWTGLNAKGKVDVVSGATELVPDGEWYLEGNIIQSQVDIMLSETINNLTGKSSDAMAWNEIFRYFNRTHDKGDRGYQPGEKIAVKINLNNSNNHGAMNSCSNISPQMVLGLLRQLVDKAGVPAGNITFYDVSRMIPSTIYDLCKSAYPDVRFVDLHGGDGRIKAEPDPEYPVNWSQELILEPLAFPAYTAYLPTCVTEADYFVNFSNLKAHSLAGITLCAKNLLGSFIAPNPLGLQPPQAAGIHPYIAVRNSDGYSQRPMNSYNSLVDLMGNDNLGSKTLIWLVDGLFAAPGQGAVLDNTCKWWSSPFNGNWTSSLFASLDNVAIESVCLDFLRAEQEVSAEMTRVTGNVDNYLHEAAMAYDPPSGTFYHPNGSTRLESLGVHEHWNNATDKQYTRNLGTGDGIELVQVIHNWGELTSVDSFIESNSFMAFPNPATDLITVRLSGNSMGEGVVQIFSLSGKILYNEKIYKQSYEINHEVNINEFSGTMILKLSINNFDYSVVILKL